MYNQRSLQFKQTFDIQTNVCKCLTNKKSYTNLQKYTTNIHKCLTNVKRIITLQADAQTNHQMARLKFRSDITLIEKELILWMHALVAKSFSY